MRLNLRLVDPASGRTDHVVLSAEPEASLSEVVKALQTIQPGPLFVGDQPLDGDGQVGTAVLRDGDVITVGRPEPPAPPVAALELDVVGGPTAGGRWPLPSGTYVLGRGADTAIRLDHPSVSRRHLRLLVEGDAAAVEDLGSRNGTTLAGRSIFKPALVRPGQLIQAGAFLLEVRPPSPPDADTSPDEAGGLAFNRPARIRRAPAPTTVAWPAAPTKKERYPFPWAQVIAPLALAVVATVVFRRPEAMLFALMSPVLAISNAMSARRRDTLRSGREGSRYASELAEAKRRLAKAAAEETARVRHEFPDPATVAAIATGPGRRLWERRQSDADATALRIGVVNRSAAVALTSRGGDTPPAPPDLHAVPVTVDLATAGVLGVAGPAPRCRALARWLVAQLAALRTPREVQLVVLTDPEADDDWAWVRFLPHVRTEDPLAPPALVGNDKASREERIRELVKLLDVRLAAVRDTRDITFLTPAVVVIFDGIRVLRALPGVPRLLKEGPAVGILSVGLDSDVTRLAEEGKAEVLIGPSEPARAELRVEGAAPVSDVLLDGVDGDWADEVARGLAPIRDAGGEDDAVIPDTVRYVDLAGIEPDDAGAVLARWTLGGRSTEALVGASVDGPFSLDLRRDGPHGLVAGTTGSGKSEFLQTLVVSLALANQPAAMNFVLIDYKGASAFADCERLPHTVGMVTNLDPHLTERALASLDAELERREHVLRDIGVADVDGAWERDPQRAAEAGLARLVIVIDEFAELVSELPEFVAGLIRVARVGRSLGVHLILATQRPAGVVSAEMRANTGLRVALRMEDKHDSLEVLESPEAATIFRSTPGRGFVRTGGSAGVVQFQTARVAGRRKGATEGVPPPRVAVLPWNRLGYPLPAAPRAEDRGVATDLHALVTTIASAAEKLGGPAPRRPWLPPLPETLVLDDLVAGGEGLGPVAYGMEDIPALQAQQPARFDMVQGGHLLIAGAPRFGRSSALRTLAGSLARSAPPSDVHLYGLDFGNGALLALTSLPHCGGVVARAEVDRMERLVARLGEEVSRRQQLLARFGFGDIAEQRAAVAPGERLPYIVVLLDRWEGFLSVFPPDAASEVPGALTRLVREGLGAGLRFVVAGDRSLLGDRLASMVDDKLVMRLADRSDYRLVNLNPRQVPAEMPEGRAVRADSGTEVQVALLTADPTGQAQAEALRRLGQEAAQRWPAGERTSRPFRVDVLPSSVSLEEAWGLAEPMRPTSPLWMLVGVGGDELSAFGVDLAAEGGGFVIGGPAKSGRSTALLTAARSLLRGGCEVVVLCPRPSPLRELEGQAGVLGVMSGTPAAEEVTTALSKGSGPLAVLIDDAEALSRTDADEAVREFLRSAAPGRAAVVVAGQVEEMKNELRGAVVEAKKAKAGLLLSPSSTLDGELVSVRLARNLVGRTPPGRGVLALHGGVTVVQVPATT